MKTEDDYFINLIYKSSMCVPFLTVIGYCDSDEDGNLFITHEFGEITLNEDQWSYIEQFKLNDDSVRKMKKFREDITTFEIPEEYYD